MLIKRNYVVGYLGEGQCIYGKENYEYTFHNKTEPVVVNPKTWIDKLTLLEAKRLKKDTDKLWDNKNKKTIRIF